MAEWISVKDRLPEDEEEVLIYEVGEMYIATYTIKLFFTDFNEDNVAIRHPSHWMPLPEPPEGSDGMEDLLNSEPAWRQSMTAQINVFVNEVAQKTEDLIVAKMTEHLTAHGYDKQIEINGANLRACIEKQIPKKIEEQRWIHTKCKCGYVFSVHHGDGYHSIPYEKQTKYCPDCGQRLDWGNEQ